MDTPIRIPDSLQGIGATMDRIPTPEEALWLFATPVRVEMARKEAAVADTGERFTFGDGIAAWRWGSGPRILLMHGWNGRGLNLSSFVQPLVDAGYEVIAIDAPGHGDSAGDYCYAPLYADAATLLAQAQGEFYAVVAHSFGTCAATVAMKRGLRFEKAVYLSAFCYIKPRFFEFSAAVGLDSAGQQAMWQHTEDYFGPGLIESFHGDVAAKGFTAQGLIIHDQDDPEILVEQAQAMAAVWPNCELMVTEKLGHYRLIRSREVIEKVTEFLGGGNEI
ncbi:MAG: alpha/beta hydrolase [Fimbriimonadaceae bacterium]|nr:MAG: alpha/beta hydrolase [Fimbriimonadaceae bacterium]